MTRHVFIKELEELNNNVIKMGSVLELSLNEMIVCLDNIDVQLAKGIIARDDDIDLLEQNIEKECINLIAKQQPIASDLRKITSIMKIVTDIERIADHCSDISEYLIQLQKLPAIGAPANLTKMISVMKNMVIETIDSFVNQDTEKAAGVIAKDDLVDEYFSTISKDLIKMMQDNSKIIPQCVSYLMIIKYLERMADHSTNIAEWIQFIVTGDLTIG